MKKWKKFIPFHSTVIARAATQNDGKWLTAINISDNDVAATC